tara:strand:+ start:1626 stop:2447 length:822 start_codon:yes stop_codon:yes gene_type:complete
MTSKLLNIHTNINEKLEYFIKAQKIPNIIFHGPSGSGKRTIVNNFVKKIYNNSNDLKKKHIMYVDCGHGRGIKFIREELKFFAKTNIHTSGDIVKSVILLNADKLTIDAQSALRRCIELFSKTTRFFIIIEDKFKLLRPILSRFCEIFINRPVIDNVSIDLHKYNNNNCFNTENNDKVREKYLQNQLNKLPKKLNQPNIIALSNKLYQKGYSGLDIMKLIENNEKIEPLKKYTLLCTFSKIKKEFRNEKIIIYSIIVFTFFRSDHNLENISFI